MDDLLVFGKIIINQWFYLQFILIWFGVATGLCINRSKSFLIYDMGDTDGINFITKFMRAHKNHIMMGFTYLGFRLKPCAYKIIDWTWLIDKFKKKIMKWKNKWLSLGGRYIMVQAVLSQFMVYWTHLYYLSVCTVDKINAIIANFLWVGAMDHKKIHLCKLAHISILKIFGGQSLLNLRVFTNVLLLKSLWRALKGEPTCSKIIYHKYVDGDPIHFLCQRSSGKVKNASMI